MAVPVTAEELVSKPAEEASIAARNDEEFTIITTGGRDVARKVKVIDEETPLVDTTAALTLRSKKTARAKRRHQKKQIVAAQKPSLLNLPPELLLDVLTYLTPSDVLKVQRVSRSVNDFIKNNENPIAREIIRQRYWVLSRCFPLPVPFEQCGTAQPALLSEKRQEMLNIHKKPYQHIKGIDPLKYCTCMACVFAWNNLCLIVDLSHWQKNLNNREPIPMIARGTTPDWNGDLLEANAAVVERAMASKLWYALILEKHLATTVGTILRTFRGKKTIHPKRVYHLTQAEAAYGTDEFLERSGPPSYEFPWHRDNYYSLEAYVPNRKWSKEGQKWMYYAESMHDRDLQWLQERFNGVGRSVVEYLTDKNEAAIPALELQRIQVWPSREDPPAAALERLCGLHADEGRIRVSDK